MSFQLITPKSAAQRDSKQPVSFSSSHRNASLEPPAYTTDDILAAKYRKYSKYWQWMRVGITVATLAVSIAVIACAASSLRGYSDTHLESEWLLPLWPLSVDLRPTHAVLACGIVVAVADLLYLAPALFPSVGNPRSPNPTFADAILSLAFSQAPPPHYLLHRPFLPMPQRRPLHHRLCQHHHLSPCEQHRRRYAHILDLQMAGL